MGLKLSELDFIVEHRPGTKIVHVDALSRHVGRVTINHFLDKVTVLQEQKKEAFCTNQTTGSHSCNSDLFLDEEGTIRGVTGGTDQTSGGCSLCYTIPI